MNKLLKDHHSINIKSFLTQDPKVNDENENVISKDNLILVNKVDDSLVTGIFKASLVYPYLEDEQVTIKDGRQNGGQEDRHDSQKIMENLLKSNLNIWHKNPSTEFLQKSLNHNSACGIVSVGDSSSKGIHTIPKPFMNNAFEIKSKEIEARITNGIKSSLNESLELYDQDIVKLQILMECKRYFFYWILYIIQS